MKHLIVLFCLLATSQAFAASRHFDHVVIIMFENTNYETALQQPFFRDFAKKGALMGNYTGVIHPSQGNYIALTSGDINGAPDDENYEIKAKNIADLLEEKGLTWKSYAEAYPGHCFTGMNQGTYWRKHNPFISYTGITKNSKRCAKIVNADQFEKDARAGDLPNYSFYVPDINNDGHDTGPVFANNWFSKRWPKFLNDPKFMKKTLVIATFDENSGEADMRVFTALVGPMVNPGVYKEVVTHYSLLRMIEDNFFLGTLGKKDQSAKAFPNVWK